MEIRVIIIGGEVQIFVDGDGVSYEQAAEATRELVASLQADGLQVNLTTGIEQHKDGADHAHVTRQLHHSH